MELHERAEEVLAHSYHCGSVNSRNARRRERILSRSSFHIHFILSGEPADS